MAGNNYQILGKGRQVALIGSLPESLLPASDETCSATLDGRLWLIGRIRLDAREELSSASRCPGSFENTVANTSDALNCLRAYARWGDRFLEHLRGDFCFVLWDDDRQRLFGVRDHLGVRPLFYTMEGNSWLVSDSLELVAAGAAIKGDLDDYWVADFLTYGFCTDLDRTVYKQVKRLPPAHFLSVTAHSYSVRKYWTLEIRDPIYYPRSRNYVEHFEEVISLAIKDRLPPHRVGISMSGGLDSPTLAAHTLRATGDASKIVAYTRHFNHLMPDVEKHFSSLVATKLGIRLILRAVDDAFYDPHWYDRTPQTPEPNPEIVRAVPERIITGEMAKEAQVWFFGEGPDNALVFEWQPYLKWLCRSAEWYHLGSAVVQYLLSKQAREWQSTVINCMKKRPEGERNPVFAPPEWLNPVFVKELQLLARARQSKESSKDKHPWHPRAIASFSNPRWQRLFERLDPSASETPLKWRHPYLDLRVLTFLLSVPPIPWARRKRLIRKAMRGILPAEILSRNKCPLHSNPINIMLQKHWVPQLPLDRPILRYIDHTKLPIIPNELTIGPLIRVHVLNSWLNSRRPAC